MSPKLIGYLCEHGAYTFYENGHALLRTLPRGFQALPVAHLTQVGFAEIVKAFRLGATSVLLCGCATCRMDPQRTTVEHNYAEALRELERFGVSSERLVLAWCSHDEPEIFFELVHTTMANLERQPPLVLPRMIDNTIQHCG